MDALRQVSSPMTLIPAYGRKGRTPEAMLADWNAGKDFKIFGGPYCSIRDFPQLQAEASSVRLWCPMFNTEVIL